MAQERRDLTDLERLVSSLKDMIDPDHGLLIKLKSKCALSREEAEEVKAQSTYIKRNQKILEYVCGSNKCEEFLLALRDSNLSHIANYIEANGVYNVRYGNNWPLMEQYIKILDANEGSLVDLLDPDSGFLESLYSAKVLNKWQRDTVNSLSTLYERNETLLNLIRRCSLNDYLNTITCLRVTNQPHIAEILEEGGVALPLHVSGFSDEVETHLSSTISHIVRETIPNASAEQIQRVLQNAGLNLISAKKGNSVTLYFLCKMVKDLEQIEHLLKTGRINGIIKELFTIILRSRPIPNMRVKTSLSDSDLKKAKNYFQGGGGQELFVNLNTVDPTALQAGIMKSQALQQPQPQQKFVPYKTLASLSLAAGLAIQPQQAKVTQSTVTLSRHGEPHVTITEQPKAQSLRFQYRGESRSSSSIPGDLSTNEKRTFPTIQIHNFDGPVAMVVVSCVTKDKPYAPHPHNLVGQDCRDGVCTVKVKGHNTVSFPNIGIQCCKRQDVEESLKVRERIRIDPFGTGYTQNINDIDLTSVRLCFQVFLPDNNKKFTRIVQPIVSQCIESIHDLFIHRLSRQSGSANGGDEVFLLCEKINKDDIQVRFYQETEDGVSWEAYGNFVSCDVHRQCAIVFRTPAYRDTSILSPVNVYIQLHRPSDDEMGDPKPFQYIPWGPDPYGIERKRKRKEVNLSGLYNDKIPMTVMQEFQDLNREWKRICLVESDESEVGSGKDEDTMTQYKITPEKESREGFPEKR